MHPTNAIMIHPPTHWATTLELLTEGDARHHSNGDGMHVANKLRERDVWPTTLRLCLRQEQSTEG